MDGLWVKVYPLCGWIQGVVQLLTAMRGRAPLRAGSHQESRRRNE